MKSPFKFLDSYTREDRDVFFGREREIEELYHRVFESKILLVYGVSGTGKSSLIHCGLANKFSETDWLPLVIRRGGNIIESMAAGISSASLTIQQRKFNSPSDFKKGVRSLYLDHYKPVFFIFDQFEELFIFGDKEERQTFIRIVKILTESDLQCRFIFVMREEYMASFTEFERVIPAIFQNRVRIEKMSHQNAIEAIHGPCRVFNISLEEGFAEALLEKLSPGSEDVELTYLQVFLDKIFRLSTETVSSPVGEFKESSSITFTPSLLEKTGNVSDLLGNFLEGQIKTLQDPDTGLAVLKSFVSLKGTKKQLTQHEVIESSKAFGKDIPANKVSDILLMFVNLRILHDKDENRKYELRHDALAEKVFEKFSTAERELLEIRQFIENSFQSYLKRKILLNNDDLKYISNKDSLLNLNADLTGFLEASRKYIKESIQSIKRLTYVSAGAFIVLIVILVYFGYSRIIRVNANYEAVKSMTQAINLTEKLNMAKTAWMKNQDVFPKEALLKAFNGILFLKNRDSLEEVICNEIDPRLAPGPEAINYAFCSRDNKYIVGYSDSMIMIWCLKGGSVTSFNTPHFPLIDIKISDDSRYIGTISSDSILSIWDTSGKLLFDYKISYNIINTRQIFCFTKENNILCLTPGKDAVLLDRQGNIIQEFRRHHSTVNAVAISINNKFIATASSDKTINIWYQNRVKSRFDYYNTLTHHSDTVWSVSFSKAGTSILSASADMKVLVRTINNEYVDFSHFPDNLKYCYAEFSESEKGIIAELYFNRRNTLVKALTAINYNNPAITVRPRGVASENYSDFVFHSFSNLTFSPNEDYFTYSDNGKSFLADNKLTMVKDRGKIFSNHNLLFLDGINPFFTADSKYVIVIDKNTLKAYFTDINTILKYSP